YTQCRAIRWLRVYEPSLPLDQLMHNQFSQMTIYQLHDGSIDRDKLEQLLGLQGEAQPGARPHVLIIDEINRGNISRIFGELITLIEPSKRVGEDEALEVILPYSKERFGVPGNVHLIGTMNTADRSLTGLDIA
ncbi:AAA family ATPase, partial [Lysobacter sp. 2RAB21]